MTAKSSRIDNVDPPRSVRVWDVPTRLFHWSLVLLVATSLYTGNVGGLREMDLHKLSGYAILALVLFRLVWGVVGSPRSRFSDFVRGPGAVIGYARSLLSKAHRGVVGHNPMGGWSVMAMLASLSLQAITGLFSRDDILTEGPLVRYVSKETSRTLSAIHDINATVLYVLIGLHLAAVLGYLIFRKDNLIRPMLTGRKTVAAAEGGHQDEPFARAWVAGIILAAAAGAVWLVVSR
ncbi:MAG: cytochrome b/b6 domain-containing protein [Rhodospirillales bacterium]|nr:cytochrome b/b6 domain-containing protein [Rhodospirillales bacterium]